MDFGNLYDYEIRTKPKKLEQPRILTDLTSLKYDINPAINREGILIEIQKALLKVNKPNVLIIGEPGVGKTAIAEGLAYLIKKKKCHELLLEKKIYSVSTAQLLSGTRYRGDFEEKVQKICDFLKQEKAILFVDEMHTTMKAGGAEGAVDMANILKPYLARGDFSLIGATTSKEYEIIKNDSAYNRRFTIINIEEPNEEATCKILLGSLRKFEKHYNLTIDKALIKKIVENSKYIKGKNPDKSLDILENLFIERLFNRKDTIDEEDLQIVIDNMLNRG